MATISIFNDKAFNEKFKAMMNAEFCAAAEPIIQQAIKEVEIEVRKRIAIKVISLVDKSYSAETNGQVITLRVDMGRNNAT